MRNNKVTQFVKEINTVLSATTKEAVRNRIGDSNNTERNLSVNQVIRYLRLTKRTTLANQLETVYTEFREQVRMGRTNMGLTRNDATEYKELVNELLFVAEYQPSIVQVVRNLLKKAA